MIVETLRCSEMSFQELIGIMPEPDSKPGNFRAYFRIKEDRIFLTKFSATSSDQPINTFYWEEMEEAQVLAAAMVAGRRWSWLHKEISPSDNWGFTKMCMLWAVMRMRGDTVMEPSFRMVDGEAVNSYVK